MFFAWQNFFKKIVFNYKFHSAGVFDQNLKIANDAHNSRDYENAIDTYRKLLSDTKDGSSKVKIQAKLADSLLNKDKNDLDSILQGLSIQKSIVANIKNTPKDRALVLNEIAAFIVTSNQSELFIRKNFNQDPFSKLIPDDSRHFNARDFAIKLYEYSDEIYPNSYAKFLLASNLTGVILEKTEAVGGVDCQKSSDTLVKIKNYIKDGTNLNDGIEYEVIQKLKMYFSRAVASQLCLKKNNLFTLEDVENNYKSALAEADKYNDNLTDTIRFDIHFYYADFLLRHKKAPESEISSVIDPVISSGSIGYSPNVKEHLLINESAFMRSLFNNFSENYQPFKKYLENIGWKFK